jgi:hypothetical protein
MKPRIMYVEYKGDGLSGRGWITRVSFSKSGSSVYFCGRRLQTLGGAGFKANYRDVETGEQYWVSGPKRNGRDRLDGGPVEVDEEVREEYRTQVRQQPEHRHLGRYRC